MKFRWIEGSISLQLEKSRQLMIDGSVLTTLDNRHSILTGLSLMLHFQNWRRSLSSLPLFLSAHKGLMDVVVAAGTLMTYVGEPGSIHPDRTLQHAPIASLAQQLAARVRGKSVVLTCPVTLERSARETVVENLFEHAQVEALYLLSEPIAACYATGCEKIRVLDCGHTHATVSFVENGQTTKETVAWVSPQSRTRIFSHPVA